MKSLVPSGRLMSLGSKFFISFFNLITLEAVNGGVLKEKMF